MAAIPEAWVNILPTLLMSLKVDIGISTTAYDERLTQYLKSAYKQIQREGITLDAEEDEDREIVTMYARWTWRKRDSGEGMPRMLRYAMNNRLFSEKMQVEEDG